MNHAYEWAEAPGQTAFPIARAGYSFIFGAAFATAILAILHFTVPALVGLVVTACICGFFRDPDRAIPTKKGALVSPADGKVILVERVESNPFIEGPTLKISIFMSVFNVHVNRAPASGRVADILYHPGRFVSAHLDKASSDNERNAVILDLDAESTESGGSRRICVVQIAGLIARRIVCYVQPGDTLRRGRRFGLICFGSRLDVYLPTDTMVDVKVGDRVRAGASVLGTLA